MNAPVHSSPLAGTGHLLRLYLRLDRVRLSCWILAFLVLIPSTVVSLQATFPDQESLQARAALQDNPAAIMMTGPLFSRDDYTFGVMLANELSLWVFLAAAIMSVLFMVRHTRADEEAGRLEMLRALPIGRFASASAALILVALADLAVGVAVTAGLIVPGMAAADSLAFGVATTLTGLVFGAVAAVAAQLTGSSRAATGLGLSAIVLAFVIRGIGDVIDHQGSWLSWFSPFAWAQQTRLYADLRWWPLAVAAVVAAALIAITLSLSGRRDLGTGLRQDRPGSPRASSALLSPAGLAHRLETPTFLAWTVGLFFFAVAFGSLTTELEGVVEQMPAIGEWTDLNLEDLTRSFGGLVLAYLSLGPAVLLVSGVLRLRTEERDGRVTGLLVGGSSRPGLLSGWCAVVAVEAILAQVVLGFGLGLGMTLASGETRWLGEITVSSVAYLPAILFFGALAAALFGLLPRFTILAWVLTAWTAMVLFLGELLDLPDWARWFSPLWHIPAVPDADLNAMPLVVLVVMVVVLTVIGLAGFRRRDIIEG